MNKKIGIYGTGAFAEKFLLSNPNIKISYVFDTNKSKQGKNWNGVIVNDITSSMDQIIQEEIIVIITSTYSNEISAYLNSYGLKEGIHFIIYNGESLDTSIKRSLTVKLFSNPSTINDICFSNFIISINGHHVTGFSEEYIVKLELGRDLQKKNDISKEVEIISHLNNNNAVSCPKIIDNGTYNGNPYFIIERKQRYSRPPIPDLLFSLLEQKNLGVFQGDLKPDNIIYDGSICYLIDYDQALFDETLKTMPFDEFIIFIRDYSEKYYGFDTFSVYQEYFGYENFQAYIKNGALKIGQTSLMRKQETTLEADGFYHTIQTENIYLKGARDSKLRESVLEQVFFKQNEKVLDVGCNLGLLSNYLDKRGCNVVGIDLDPHVVNAAQMIGNIENRKTLFRNIDIDLISVEDNFDTVFLFSVLQHFNDLEDTSKKLSNMCQRIIFEIGLMEFGMKPAEGDWKYTSKWNFAALDELIVFLEGLFKGLQFYKSYGKSDRNRYVLEFRK